jgi:uncharacterized protein YggE
VGVVSHNPASDKAIADNANAMAGVYSALESLGVTKKEIQTISFTVAEDRETEQVTEGKRQTTRSVRTGFRVTNLVRVTVSNLKDFGKILDSLTSRGANSVRGIEFGNTKSKDLLVEARKQAVAEAKAKAVTISEALEIPLGIPQLVSEEHRRSYPEFGVGASRLASADSAPTEISGGSLDFSVTVNITWKLGK